MTTGILKATAHRPFPLPRRPWIMFQSWRDLLFAHWPVSRCMLRPLVPAELELDEFDGTCWIGQAPFRLVGLRPRFLPPLPGVSQFLEMNLRTYVRRRGVPGIFFFSLDAASWFAVKGARAGYKLPYYHAEMDARRSDGWTRYRSRRRGERTAEFVGRYRAAGPAVEPTRGTLEYFLTERYALFTVTRGGKVLRGDIHHLPWNLRAAEAVIERNGVPAAHEIALPDVAPILHHSARQDTLVWAPQTAP